MLLKKRIITMKKITIIVCLLLLCVAGACSNDAQRTNEEDQKGVENNEKAVDYVENMTSKSLADDDYITTGIDSVSQAEIVIEYTNNANELFTYGKAYGIERLENGGWKEVSFLPLFAFDDIGYAVGAGQSFTETIDLVHEVGVLNAGHYRISKDFHSVNLKFIAIAEFDIA